MRYAALIATLFLALTATEAQAQITTSSRLHGLTSVTAGNITATTQVLLDQSDWAGARKATPTVLFDAAGFGPTDSPSLASLVLTGNLSATGNITLTGNLTVTGISNFTGTATFAGAIDTNLTSGRVPFLTTNGLLTDTAGFTYTAPLLTVTNANLTGTLLVGGATTLSGAITGSSNLAITGNSTLGGTLTVTGNSTISGTSFFLNLANFQSAVTMDSNVTVSGAITGSNSLAITGNADIGGNLTVTGNIVNSGVTTRAMEGVAVEYATAVATGTGKLYMVVPPSMNGKSMNYVLLHTLIEGTTGTNGVQFVRDRGGSTANMLSTIASIDSDEKSSATAAVPYVIDTDNDDLQTGDLIRIDVSNVTTSAATGLIIVLEAN